MKRYIKSIIHDKIWQICNAICNVMPNISKPSSPKCIWSLNPIALLPDNPEFLRGLRVWTHKSCNLPHAPQIWLYPTVQVVVPSFLGIVSELEGRTMSHQNYNITYLGGKLEQDATEQVINKTITIQNVEILYATI